MTLFFSCWQFWLTAPIAYLLGCSNGSVLVSKYILHDDVRNHGSGNAGLTNFHRVFGAKLVPLVILSDVLKAVLALLIGWGLSRTLGADVLASAGASQEIARLTFQYWAAIFCLLGHMFPCMFHFRGGKGILSGGTVALMVDWRIGLLVWGAFLILVIATRYVSLGSIAAGALFPVGTALFHPGCGFLLLMGFILGGMVIWGHRANIVRLIHGNENRFTLHRDKGGTT